MPGWGISTASWGCRVERASRNRKGPNFGVTETQVTCETASKFCHLSEPPYLQKGILKQILKRLDCRLCGQPASWHTEQWETFGSTGASELALLGTPSTRGTRWIYTSQELPSSSKAGRLKGVRDGRSLVPWGAGLVIARIRKLSLFTLPPWVMSVRIPLATSDKKSNSIGLKR